MPTEVGAGFSRVKASQKAYTVQTTSTQIREDLSITPSTPKGNCWRQHALSSSHSKLLTATHGWLILPSTQGRRDTTINKGQNSPKYYCVWGLSQLVSLFTEGGKAHKGKKAHNIYVKIPHNSKAESTSHTRLSRVVVSASLPARPLPSSLLPRG